MREPLVVWVTRAGCTSGASIDGTATIAVIDIRGQSAAGIELVSSVDAIVLAMTTTDPAGMASIGAARYGEVTG